MNPSFELNGKTYEILPTNYLIAKFDEIRAANKYTDAQEVEIAKYAKMQVEYDEICTMMKAAKQEYFDDVLNKEKKAKYKAFKEEADEMFEEIMAHEASAGETSMAEVQKRSLANCEQVVICGIAERYFPIDADANVFDTAAATKVWEEYVSLIGKETAAEWVTYAVNVLFSNEVQDDPFLAKAKEAERQKAEQRKGYSKIKR